MEMKDRIVRRVLEERKRKKGRKKVKRGDRYETMESR